MGFPKGVTDVLVLVWVFRKVWLTYYSSFSVGFPTDVADVLVLVVLVTTPETAASPDMFASLFVLRAMQGVETLVWIDSTSNFCYRCTGILKGMIFSLNLVFPPRLSRFLCLCVVQGVEAFYE